FVECYSKSDAHREYPIILTSLRYPVTVAWRIQSTDDRVFTLTGVKQTLKAQGKLILTKETEALGLTIGGQNMLPSSFSLSENYPNPFNPSTKFEIGVPKLAFVDISIYNIMGQKVRTLFHGEKAAGYYFLEWNGYTADNAPAAGGVYFVRMESDKFTTVHKIML